MQDQRASFGDEVWPQIGTEQRFSKLRLLSEIKLLNGLEEGEARAPRAALQTRLLPLGDFIHQQLSDEIAIGPAFLFSPSGEGLVDPARVQQVETAKQRTALGSREGQTGGRVLILLCGHRFLPIWCPCIPVRKTSPPGDTLTHGGSEKCSHGLVNAIFFGPTCQIGKTVAFVAGAVQNRSPHKARIRLPAT